MTPNDIQNKRFEKGMGGYRTEEVHLFLSQVADYVSGMEEENNELLEKMGVLADKLEQYREDEESLRAALIGAQKLGQSVIKESQQKAESIVTQAVQKAEGIVSGAQKNIDKEEMALKRMRREVSSFREQIISLYTQHLEVIKTLPGEEVSPGDEAVQITYEETEDAFSFKEDGQQNLLDDEDDDQFIFAAEGAQSSQSTDMGFPKRKKNFKELDQFFGEDKPVERQ